MAPRDWDAATYHEVSEPQEALGRAVLERLPLRGDETVLDAGCGTGRVTRPLAERLPRGRVIAVDGSPSMVERARSELGPDADVRLADLLELSLAEEVDAVFSTATFHWILDHPRLFARLRAALRPGGRLVAQCGGAGNVASILAAVPAGEPCPWRFASPEEAARDLEAAGFEDVETWLEPVDVRPERPRDYLRTVLLGPFLDRRDPAERDAFVDAVARRLPDPLVVDYVRLNLSARAGP